MRAETCCVVIRIYDGITQHNRCGDEHVKPQKQSIKREKQAGTPTAKY